ncbi:MAG: F0F1 ATP synthase subunit B [Bacteroidaceae bacterium]|nr:F0F1 ATP synthase subunit B [Bacteroidaceae bacterium]
MDLLLPSEGLIFWMSLTFIIVFLILWKWGFPAIGNMIDERKKFIDESLAAAKEANEKLATIQQQGESILQEARAKQADILKEATATRAAIIAQAETKARNQGARMLDEAKAEIEAQKQAAINDIKKQVAELSVGIAEKILREKLNSDSSQEALIDKMLSEVK